MENGIGAELVGELCHLGNGHHRANLVVDHHHGDQNGILAQRRLEFLGGDLPQGIGLQVGHFIPLGFQLLHTVQNGMMLHGGGDDVLAPLAHALDGTHHRPVVCLGAAGGEEHPVGLCAHGGGNLVPCAAKHPGGFNAEIIQSAGIAPMLRQCPHHGIHRLRAGLGGG